MKNFLSALLIAAVFFASCGGNEKQKMGKPVNEANTVFTVRSALAEKKTFTTYIDVNGDIETIEKVDVYPDMAGDLKELRVQLGDKVKKGQVIATVDPSTPGAFYNASPVKANISGSVVATPYRVGSKVSPQTAIASIGDTSRLQISAKIPERYVGTLKTDLKADIRLEAYPGAVFRATLKRISPVVDATSRTKQVQFEFDEHDSRLNAGMFAKVRLFTQTVEDAIVVPASAILMVHDEPSVFVVRDGAKSTVERRTIVAGSTVDGLTQIAEGINEGERIVTQGIQVLTDGAEIHDISK